MMKYVHTIILTTGNCIQLILSNVSKNVILIEMIKNELIYFITINKIEYS